MFSESGRTPMPMCGTRPNISFHWPAGILGGPDSAHSNFGHQPNLACPKGVRPTLRYKSPVSVSMLFSEDSLSRRLLRSHLPSEIGAVSPGAAGSTRPEFTKVIPLYVYGPPILVIFLQGKRTAGPSQTASVAAENCPSPEAPPCPI